LQLSQRLGQQKDVETACKPVAARMKQNRHAHDWNQAMKLMNYLERFRSGEYEQVWGDLQALGHAVR